MTLTPTPEQLAKLEQLDQSIAKLTSSFFAASPVDKKGIAFDLRELKQLRKQLHDEVYLVKELPEALENLEAQDLEQLQQLRYQLRLQLQVTAGFWRKLHGQAEESEVELCSLIVKELRRQEELVSQQVEKLKAAAYKPEEGEAPAYESAGYSARAGFVKERPENNDYYIAQFKEHPWFPIIAETHSALNQLMPGYNINQIKEKFGRLCYYYNLPEPVVALKDDDVSSKLVQNADRIIARAQGWVEGYEYAKGLSETS